MTASPPVAIKRDRLIGEVEQAMQPRNRVWLCRLDALAHHVAAVPHQRLVCVLTGRVLAVGPAHAPTPLTAEPPGKFRLQRAASFVGIARQNYPLGPVEICGAGSEPGERGAIVRRRPG